MSEQIDFFALMQQNAKNEEPVKEEIKDAEVVEKQQAKEPGNEVKDKLKKEPKKNAKKETNRKTSKPKSENKTRKNELQPKSLEEQIATVPEGLKTPIDRIFKYLMTVPGMEEKMRNQKKNITDMFKFIMNKARDRAVDGCAQIEDQEVFGWAVHYYDEENPE